MSNRPNTKKHGRTPPRVAAAQESQAKGLLQSPIVWIGGLILVAAVVAIALAAAGGDDTSIDPDVEETAFAEIIGDALPVLTAPDPAAGAPAPQIVSQTLAGERVQIHPDDGTARVVVFLAHWCPHCRAELPRIVDWMGSNELPGDTEILAISTAVDATAPNYPPSAWLAEEGFAGTVLVDTPEGALAQGFGLSGFPFGVALAADGSVLARWSGELTEDQFGQMVTLAGDSVADNATLDDASDGDAAGESSAGGLRTVEADDAAALLVDPPSDLVVLDVRTIEEFEAGHLDGATMIDFYLPDFADRLAELDRDVPYLLYCRSGNRSGQTLALMEDLGFSDVTEIGGGINAWVGAGHPVST